MSPRIRCLAQPKARVCPSCGARLQQALRSKYDRFWMVCLICLGAALAFYLIGLLIMAAGLWLWVQRQADWVCPACSCDAGTASLVL
jgi:hypothetical protein